MTGSSRLTLHRIAVHVLARRRYQVTGRFGLRASPGGFATPAFGVEPEVVRVAGTDLVREVAGECRLLPVDGSSLADLARFADADLDTDFQPGADGPGLGDPDAPLRLDHAGCVEIADWFALGWSVLDQVLAVLPEVASPATIQLWPEHFDAATHVLAGAGRVNLGFSPGDSFCGGPYAYVGPWTDARPGQSDYWNAPFGAVLTADSARLSGDPRGACADFLQKGLAYLSADAEAGAEG